MTRWQLRLVPDPVLREISLPVYDFSAITPLVARLFELSDELQGVGMAAPQVGVSMQVAVVTLPQDRFVLVNPVVVQQEGRDYALEGCLSIPDVEVLVPRSTLLTVLAYDQHGTLYTRRTHGLQARVLQHEIDHLYGKLITDYGPAEQR